MCKAPNGAGGDEQKALSRVTVRSTNENELDRPAVNFLWHTGLAHLFTTTYCLRCRWSSAGAPLLQQSGSRM